ncbi:VCBS repeat-containing protein [Aestuariivivens insulae]|uniref:VCBS repeat-containing protein n=1 Tax=Aestuariivivens insulae TaxID=1621988 RepID=UPI001F570600|nr:VCBS repeat-containing protein [Aestuariivivens insulae]
MGKLKLIPYCFILMLILGCEESTNTQVEEKLFTQILSEESGVDFINHIKESEDFHYYQYIYSYNGGGVAAADFNNDGLVDLFFTANTSQNKLYLNKGDFHFEDITEKAGIKDNNGFNMGISVADVNNDGYLDIYICRAGWFKEAEKLKNLLYINNGNLSFTEQAEIYGLADTSRTIAASFFDYDNDGDLDVYMSNAPTVTRDYKAILDLNEIATSEETIALKGSDKLYKNDGEGHFQEVSKEAGIIPDRGFGLNPQVGDLNNDGWLDVYVNNDFSMPDFAYINNGDGTFSDKKHEMFKHMSFYSMGGDIADINNDGLYDMMALDMNPEDYVRSKTTMSMTSIDKFWEMVNKGYHYQYMHNVLQLNNGNGTFSEIGNMAGIANTDWSWAPLLADFDLDGYNDIYITNGVYRDVIDKDTNKKILDIIRKKGKKPTKAEYLEYTQMLPQQKMTNYFFKNNGDITFSDRTTEWAEMQPTFSNGAVYADFDNDGDLDVVVNNINEKASILKNNARELDKGSYLQFQFVGADKNKFGVGVTATLFFEDGTLQKKQLINTRGYLSSVSNKLHFGFSKTKTIKTIEMMWPDRKVQKFHNVKPNQLITVRYAEAALIQEESIKEEPKIFEKTVFNYTHKDSVFDDFQIQLLLPHKLSQLGPGAAKADINNDGLDDLYLGGGYMQEGQFLMGMPSGKFKKETITDFSLDKTYEDIGAVFFDADNDGDQDLYVVSGSYEFAEGAQQLQDRLYLNKGYGNFRKCTDCLPDFYESGSVVDPADFDNDGDIDLFVGGRLIPGKYPHAPKSYILVNNKGKYTIKTQQLAPSLEYIGMVTDAHWVDMDADNDLDLVLTGEWMGIEVFENNKGILSQNKKYDYLSNKVGWWNKLLIKDIDGDGDKDIIAGNLGLNTKFHASEDKPFHIYTKDFDHNGTEDVFLAKHYKDRQVPVRGKSCTAQQMPVLKEKIKSYQEFANNDLQGILGEGIKTALHYKANEFRSGIFLNRGGEFIFEPFTYEVQRSPINSMLLDDFDNDGQADLLLAGNNYQVEIETTRNDAGVGAFLKGNGKGQFNYMPTYKTGFIANKNVRNMLQVSTTRGTAIIVINNNETHQLFDLKKE